MAVRAWLLVLPGGAGGADDGRAGFDGHPGPGGNSGECVFAAAS
jgi:hypothetical protein